MIEEASRKKLTRVEKVAVTVKERNRNLSRQTGVDIKKKEQAMGPLFLFLVGTSYPMKPRFEEAKLLIFGNTIGISESKRPNQRARVAAY